MLDYVDRNQRKRGLASASLKSGSMVAWARSRYRGMSAISPLISQGSLQPYDGEKFRAVAVHGLGGHHVAFGSGRRSAAFATQVEATRRARNALR